MTVYYTSTQQRIMGRLSEPYQIRAWIRGRSGFTAPEFYIRGRLSAEDVQNAPALNEEVIERMFLPRVAAVITFSAPELLLSASLNSFLLGLGVYLGFVWRRGLDTNAGTNDSRDIFITYIVSVSICYAIYGLSSAAQSDRDDLSHQEIFRKNIQDFSERRSDLGRHRDIAGSSEHNSGHLSNQGAQGGDIETSAREIPISRPAVNRDSEVRTTEKISAGNREREVQSQGPATTENNIPNHQVLVHALQESARLRREAAIVDERIARLYEQFAEPDDRRNWTSGLGTHTPNFVCKILL